MANIIISILIVTAVVFAIKSIHKEFRSGSCSSCGGKCSDCSGCVTRKQNMD